MYMVFDVETTGLCQMKGFGKYYHPRTIKPYDSSRIVSIAWCVYGSSDHKLIKESYYVVRPRGFEIPKEAERIHKISTSEAIANGRPFSFVIDEFFKDLRKCDGLLGFNVGFDYSVLLAELYRSKELGYIRTLESKRSGLVDVMLLASEYLLNESKFKRMKWYKLTNSFNMIVKDGADLVRNAHDARFDVRMTFEIYKQIIGKYEIIDQKMMADRMPKYE